MDKQQAQLDELKEIRSLMEHSSRFLSLSGIAGVYAGITALAGITTAYVYLDLWNNSLAYYELINDSKVSNNKYGNFLFADSLIVLSVSIFIGVLLSIKKAKKIGSAKWDATAKRMFINMAIPLVSGGIYAIILFYQDNIALIAPATLIFYGMALLNASKYTINDIRYLGMIEIMLGLTASIFVEFGLLIWGLGFGVFHIIYGLSIYFKYER
jgi:hypothetical protein